MQLVAGLDDDGYPVRDRASSSYIATFEPAPAGGPCAGTGAGRGDVETRMGGTVERAEIDQIERVLNHELRERFAGGAVQRGVLLQHGDDPAIGPGQLMVRVFIPAPGRPGDYGQVLAAWQDTHRAGMEELRRELSLRLPAARLLEFTFDDPGAATPRLMMPDDGSLAAEQMSGREIVTKALSLLRANYVFPELAEQAAIAVEARLAAGEYDDLDEITLTELVTSHLQEITGDPVDQPGHRHELARQRCGAGYRGAGSRGLRRRLRPGTPARAGPGRPVPAHRERGPRRAGRAADHGPVLAESAVAASAAAGPAAADSAVTDTAVTESPAPPQG